MDNTVSDYQNASALWIIHQNVQGVSAKFEQVEVLLELYFPDILCLSGHFLRQDEMDVLNCQDISYHLVIAALGCSRVPFCILSRDSLNIQSIDVEMFCNKGICKFSAIKVISEGSSRLSYVILAVYRPPRQNVDDVEIFLNNLSNCLELLSRHKSMMDVAGDFNIEISTMREIPIL